MTKFLKTLSFKPLRRRLLYEFVRQDVEVAFRKVRPGGVIAGDDFFWKRDGKMHVKEAVLDAMRAQGLNHRPERIGQQYMITVPDLIEGGAQNV